MRMMGEALGFFFLFLPAVFISFCGSCNSLLKLKKKKEHDMENCQ